MQTRETENRPSPLSWIPWILLAIVGVLYVFCGDWWLSQHNLPTLAQLNHWDWKPFSGKPVHFLLTYPIRFLPIGMQVWALTGLSLAAALASLALLVRIVTILPQERTRLQRQRELKNRGILPATVAWLPASLALLVCAFGLTFWQNASAFSQDMLDLVLFAYVVRALAEFRLEPRDEWLYKAALVYGFGIANSSSMLGYLPLFIATVAWVKGLPFFKFQFLMKLALLGSVGLLAYLVVPIVHSVSDAGWLGFWESLRAYLGSQKAALATLASARIYVLFLAAVSVLPCMGFAFRWGEGGGDISGTSAQVTTWVTHILHALFLLLGLAIAFEYNLSDASKSEISVRHLAASAGTPVVLTVYFLSAVSLGYYAGYFQLVFGTPSIHRWGRPSALGKAFNTVVVALLIIALVGVPGALLYRNFNSMRVAHTNSLITLAKRLHERLPDGAFTLSDTPLWYYLVQAGGAISDKKVRLTHLDSSSLMSGAFHSYMRKREPVRWTPLPRDYPKKALVERSTVIRFLNDFSRSNMVFYTEPSFGFFFEAHYLEPNGLLYRLRPMQANQLEPPVPRSDLLAAEEAYWNAVEKTEFPGLIARLPKTTKTRFGASPPRDFGLQMVTTAYSRSLNWLGSRFAIYGQPERAETFFKKAQLLAPDNGAAYINEAFIQHSRTNRHDPLPVTTNVLEKLKVYGGNLETVLKVSGPIIETGNLLVQARSYADGQNLMQAAQILRLVSRRSAEPLDYEIAVAKLVAEARRPEMALEIVSQIRAKASPKFLSNITNLMDLVEVEGRSADRIDDLPRAEKILRDAIAAYPMEDTPFSTLVAVYVQRASFEQRRGQTNRSREFLAAARKTLEQQIQNQPKNVNAWVNYGAAFMRVDQFAEAIPPLTRAVEMDKENLAALLNRAICYLKIDQLTQSQQDYERARSLRPETPYQILYGLGEVALRSQRKKDAINYFEQYLKKAPPSTEAEEVRDKLSKLK